MAKVSAFSPSQWVLGRQPRRCNGYQFDSEGFAGVGAMQEGCGGTTEFARCARYRDCSHEAFMNTDWSRRLQKALQRKAAPQKGEYKVGDIVAFQKAQGAMTDENRRHPGSRIAGFDGKATCWVVNG